MNTIQNYGREKRAQENIEEKERRKELELLTNNGEEEVNLNLRIKKLKVKVAEIEGKRLRGAQVRSRTEIIEKGENQQHSF